MKSLISAIVSVFFLFIGVPSALTQTGPNDAKGSDEVKKPIEIQFTTLEGLRYSLGESFLIGDKDFESVILPLDDYETTRLFRKSQSSRSTGQIFKGLGIVGAVVGLVGILTNPSDQQSPFWLTATGGALLINISGLFQMEAQTSKFNCVQRYNRFARGEEQKLPKQPEDEKELMDFHQEAVPQSAETEPVKK